MKTWKELKKVLDKFKNGGEVARKNAAIKLKEDKVIDKLNDAIEKMSEVTDLLEEVGEKKLSEEVINLACKIHELWEYGEESCAQAKNDDY